MSVDSRAPAQPRFVAISSQVSVDPVHESLSGEAVAIEVQPVGVVFRALGALIDIACSIAVVVLFGLLGSWAADAGLLDDAGVRILMVVMIVFSFVALPCLVEVASKGRSLGRLAVGGRIVRVDGGASSPRHAIIRALTGVLEIYFTLGAIALSCGALTARSQRLGDLLAGTYCQRVRVAPLAVRPLQVPPSLAEWASLADVARLPDRLARRIAQFFQSAPNLDPAARARIAATLVGETSPYVAPLPSAPPELTLQAIIAVRRAREQRALAHADRIVARLSSAPPAPRR